MKVKKIVKNLDYLLNIKILSSKNDMEEDEVLYEGDCFDVPWTLMDAEIDTGDGNEAIYIIDNDTIGIYIIN